MVFFFQAEDGIRDCLLSRGLGDVYKRQEKTKVNIMKLHSIEEWLCFFESSGFKNINYKQVCTGKNWEGTLVVYGDKD